MTGDWRTKLFLRPSLFHTARQQVGIMDEKKVTIKFADNFRSAKVLLLEAPDNTVLNLLKQPDAKFVLPHFLFEFFLIKHLPKWMALRICIRNSYAKN
jgi:hypothetical protein